MRMKLVTINGPLGIGKTWTVKRVSELVPHVVFVRISWQDPLILATQSLLGVTGMDYDKFKVADFHGLTGRQWMIKMSEDFAKIHGGLTFFSKVMHERMLKTPQVPHKKSIFIADSNGFDHEIDYFKTRADIDLLPCSIEPPDLKDRRGQTWIDTDSRFNLAHKCAIVTEDSTTMAHSIVAALERRGWS